MSRGELVALVYKHFPDPRSARLVYESVKDGIGIDFPTHELVSFVAALTALQSREEVVRECALEEAAVALEQRAESVQGPTNAYAVGELYEAALMLRALKLLEPK